jgi:hypothetical protein
MPKLGDKGTRRYIDIVKWISVAAFPRHALQFNIEKHQNIK